jgi:hypothetical protein
MKHLNVIFLFLFFTLALEVSAKTKKFDFNVRAGFAIGASAPLGIPVTIRKIESYNPGLQLSLEVGAQYHLSEKWSLATAIRVEQKGMTTNARVKGYYTTFNQGNNGGSESITGYFTGSVQTKAKNGYLTVPLLATYLIRPKLRLKAGAYASYLLENNFTGKASNGYLRDQTPVGEKEEINEASYDFSNQVRKFNGGIEIGADYHLHKGVILTAHFDYGLTPLMKKDFQSIDFKLYNLYLNLGVGYRFGALLVA